MKIVILLPSNDQDHYLKVRRIEYIGVYDVDSQNLTSYPLNLLDCKNLTHPEFTSDEPLLVSNKKLFDRFYPGHQSYDINTQNWIYHNTSVFDLQSCPVFAAFRKFYKDYEDWVKFIPLSKCEEISQTIVADILKIPEITTIDDVSRFYLDIVYPGVTEIETTGIHIKTREFNRVFNKEYTGDFTYCYYNLHTTTGRPSNTFNNINYSALNKRDGSRDVFTSRFGENGRLLELDLDAYHLRLIGQILDYNLPDQSVHDYFGKKYFESENLTEEEYQKSKAISFRLLYGGLTDEFSHIEFFQRVEDFKDAMWRKFLKVGYIKSPLSGKTLRKETFPNMTGSKLFNYLLQTIETEYSMIFIQEIHKLLKLKASKLILYTYDSFLIDFNLQDGRELILKLVHLLKNSKLKVGTTYHNLHPFNIES